MIERRFITLGLVMTLGILVLIWSANLQNTIMIAAIGKSGPVESITSPAGLQVNRTGNMTGNTTDLVEQGMPSANPAGITSGRGPQDKFLSDEPELDG